MHRENILSELEDPKPLFSANTLITLDESTEESDKEQQPTHQDHPKIKQFLTHTFVYFFIDLLSAGVCIPAFPTMVSQASITDHSASTNLGIITSTAAAFQFICSPIFGLISDKFGRKPILIFSLLGSCLQYVFLTFVGYQLMQSNSLHSSTHALFIIILFAKIISGITSNMFVVGYSIISDVSSHSSITKNFGLMGAAFGTGFIIGPLLGGLLSKYGIAFPFAFSALFQLLNSLFVYMYMNESNQHASEFELNKIQEIWSEFATHKTHELVKQSLRGFSILFNRQNKQLFFLSATIVLIHLTQHSYQSIFVIYSSKKFGWLPLQAGLFLAALGLGTAIFQGFLLRIILPIIQEHYLIELALVVSIVASSLTAYANATTNSLILHVILPAMGSFASIAAPIIQSIISKHVNKNENGLVQGALHSVATCTRIIAPLYSTYLLRYFDYTGVPFLFNIIFIVAAMGFIGVAYGPK